jgi:hypothetical protein
MVGTDHHQDNILLWLLNVGTIAISMTNIDTVLKIVLLLLSIGYTARRWYMMENAKANGSNGANDSVGL